MDIDLLCCLILICTYISGRMKIEGGAPALLRMPQVCFGSKDVLYVQLVSCSSLCMQLYIRRLGCIAMLVRMCICGAWTISKSVQYDRVYMCVREPEAGQAGLGFRLLGDGGSRVVVDLIWTPTRPDGS